MNTSDTDVSPTRWPATRHLMPVGPAASMTLRSVLTRYLLSTRWARQGKARSGIANGRRRVPKAGLSRAALAFRAVHAVAVEMLLAIGYVWWCALTGRRGGLLLRAAVATLIGEGVLVSANGGDCPLGAIAAAGIAVLVARGLLERANHQTTQPQARLGDAEGG